MEAAKQVAWQRYGSQPDTPYLRTLLAAAAPHLMARRIVTTIEDLEELPFGSVILDGAGLSLHKNEFSGWRASNGAKNIDAEMLAQEALPATVLHEPRSAGAGE